MKDLERALRAVVLRVRSLIRPRVFSSKNYWQGRYLHGGNSGAGSYQHMAAFKAEVLNRFVRDNSVQSVIEFGCGDGNQLRLADYPRYIGYDVSIDVVETCRAIFREDPTKRFDLLKDYDGNQADLTLSLDVVYHLVEDEVFEDHMKQIFDASARFVAVYSSDTDDNSAAILSHIRHRKFTTWVSANRPDWLLLERILNKYPYNGDHRSSSFADFHFFARQ